MTITIRTLAARLSYYNAASGGLLSCLPLQLTLRGKSTTQSYRQPVYYVDLTLKDGVSLNEAIRTANEIDEQSKDAGFYQEAVDFVARQGFANAGFEIHGEEGIEILEEFYTDQQNVADTQSNSKQLKQVHQAIEDAVSIKQGLSQSVQVVN